MTQEEKQLLLIDLCARLPYGVIVDNPNPAGGAWDEVVNIDTPTKTVTLLYDGRVFSIDSVKPYLRPMSSMTEEEKKEYHAIDSRAYICLEDIAHIPAADRIDWLNAHHFDYRGLIEKSLALIAPQEMYK